MKIKHNKPFQVLILICVWSVLFLIIANKNSIAQSIGSSNCVMLRYGYMLIASILVSFFLHSNSINKIFGFSKITIIGFVGTFFAILGYFHFFTIIDINLDLLGTVFLAPLTEELFFRGLILGTLSYRSYDTLKKIVKNLVFVLFTTSLFVVSHIPIWTGSDIVGLLLFVGGSLSYSIIYLKFRTIFLNFAGHALHNIIFEIFNETNPGRVNQSFWVLISVAIMILFYSLFKNEFSELRKFCSLKIL